MNLELGDAEAAVLAEVLDTTLSDLSHEIAATDNASYRQELRERRDVIQRLKDRLGS